jgi:hypothetical protein
MWCGIWKILQILLETKQGLSPVHTAGEDDEKRRRDTSPLAQKSKGSPIGEWVPRSKLTAGDCTLPAAAAALVGRPKGICAWLGCLRARAPTPSVPFFSLSHHQLILKSKNLKISRHIISYVTFIKHLI